MLIWSCIDLFEVTSSWLYVYYVHTGYGIGFDSCSAFSLPHGSMGKSAVIFGTDIGSFLQYWYKKKRYLYSWWRTNTSIRWYHINSRTKYLINFTQLRKRYVLSLHYNGSNSFLFVNATKIYQFKAKDSEIKKKYPLC